MTTAPTPAASQSERYDYIIIGAGSAGCVLANRLSVDPACRVLLLEAGPDMETFWIRAPAGLPFLFHNKKVNWCFSTEPEAHMGGRQVYWPRGKVLGGSSAINGMLYMRGDAKDYDDWAAAGNDGWGYRDVLPYFKRMETNRQGADEWRGDSGPLQVSRGEHQHAITAEFLQSAVTAGIPANPDFNGRQQEGVGYCQHTIGKGVRSSTARAYIQPVRQRHNLVVRGEALTHRIVLTDGAATGVVFEKDGQLVHATATREVILSSGVIGSPQLLLLSGIGPVADLQAQGIPPVADMPGVGKNLQDHLGVNTVFEVRPGMSMNSVLSGWRKYMHGARYLVDRRGPLAMGTSHAQAFVCSQPGLTRPDVQLSFRPWSFTFEANGTLRMHPFPGIQLAGLQLRPQSRGTVSLRSPDPRAAPAIAANYLSAPGDAETILRALKLIRALTETAPLAGSIVREEMPGPAVASDQQMLDFIRDNSQSIYHPVGTCKMGQGVDAVVDARLRVRGVRGLRVVDASIMPALIGGNTNGPTIMIAEKAADLILNDHANA